jgi:hypothetical protein
MSMSTPTTTCVPWKLVRTKKLELNGLVVRVMPSAKKTVYS